MIEAKAAHVDALDRERLELIVEIRRLREANELLQATLDQLRPQLARSEAELIGLRGNSLVASLFTLVGGAAVSTAGYFKALASPILWVGIAVLVCGLVIMAIGSRGDRRDH